MGRFADRPPYYRLDRTLKVAVPCGPEGLVAAFSADRVVRQDELPGGIFVSTVFLVIDHGFDPSEPPVLFETLVFNDYYNGEVRQYSTWAEAEAGHQEVVADLLGARPAAGSAGSHNSQT